MRTRLITLALLGAVATVATACGGAAAARTNGPAADASASTLPARPTVPGASGTVAAINGSSMEVQNPRSGQVTVAWTASTNFTQTLIVQGTAITVGACVSATGTPASSGSNGVSVAATSVIISPSGAGGSCTRTGRAKSGSAAGGVGGPAVFGGGFARRGGHASNRGTGSSRAFPRTGASGAPRSFAFAAGTVTAVSAGGFTVDGVLRRSTFRRPRGSPKAPGSTTPPPVTRSITVTTSSSTTYQQVSTTGASSLGVGKCVVARGSADQTGAITATAISIRSAGANGCFAGFRGFSGQAGGPPGATGSSGAPSGA
ncbi:MAG: DUF5666 domain-containing protein [Actinomycetota bacterium]|nr:DUF5666 domain-containing protein [Actinomycetota bacterium]